MATPPILTLPPKVPPIPPASDPLTQVTIAGPHTTRVRELVRQSLLEYGGRFDGSVWIFQDMRVRVS